MVEDMQQGQGTLIVPTEPVGKYYDKPAPLTPENFPGADARFTSLQRNLGAFYAIVSEGAMLPKLISATSDRSFMEQAIERVMQDASFRNQLAEILHGADVRYESISVNLAWASILIEHFTRTQIPKNRELIAKSSASLHGLADILASKRDFFDAGLASAKVADIHGNMLRIGGLELAVFAEDVPVVPRQVSHSSVTLEVGGRLYYNGLPADRQLFPTLLVPEGKRLVLRLKNSTSDKVYAVFPTINGIPWRAQDVGFLYGGFETSNFPLTSIRSEKKYLKPGEEVDFDGVYVNSAYLCRSKNGGAIAEIYSEVPELAYCLAGIMQRRLTANEREILQKANPDFAQFALSQSQLNFANVFRRMLTTAKRCDLYVSRPKVADDKASSQLDNPFLGSIGVAVVEAIEPPVVAMREYHHSTVDVSPSALKSLSLDATGRGMGVAGLAHVAGGPEVGARKSELWGNYSYEGRPHSFKGLYTFNLMSLR